MADKTVRVRPTGGDYTTLGAALQGEVLVNADITGMGVLNIEIGGTWTSADTSLVQVAGFTTSAACYIHIYTDLANRAKTDEFDTSRYYRLNRAGVSISDDYVRVTGLQILIDEFESLTSYGIITGSISASNYIQIKDCRIQGVMNSNQCYGIIADTNVVMDIINCIVYDHYTIGIWGKGVTVGIYNSTIYNCGTYGLARTAGTVNATNCAICKTDDDYYGTITADYCASDDGGGTNEVAESGGGADWPDDFVSASTGDFTLKSTSALVDAGLDDPGSGLYSTDIEGQDRTAWNTGAAWDVGAYEYVEIIPISVVDATGVAELNGPGAEINRNINLLALYWVSKSADAGDDLLVNDMDGNTIWEGVADYGNFSQVYPVSNRVHGLHVSLIDSGTLYLLQKGALI